MCGTVSSCHGRKRLTCGLRRVSPCPLWDAMMPFMVAFAGLGCMRILLSGNALPRFPCTGDKSGQTCTKKTAAWLFLNVTNVSADKPEVACKRMRDMLM